jgi:hypothetical protein
MKHPSDVEYKRGRPKIPMPRMVPDESTRAYIEELVAVCDEAKLKAQEDRVRKEFKVMPPYLAWLAVLTLCYLNDNSMFYILFFW